MPGETVKGPVDSNIATAGGCLTPLVRGTLLISFLCFHYPYFLCCSIKKAICNAKHEEP